MQVNILSTEKGSAKLQILVPAEELTKALDQEYATYSKNHPEEKLERETLADNEVGQGLIRNAVQDVFSDLYAEAIRETGLQVASQPRITVLKADEEEGIEVSLEFALRPEVKLGQYKGIHVACPDFVLTEEELRYAYAQAAKQKTETVVVDRPAQLGDTATIDFTGYLEGVPFDGGAGTDYPLVLGSGSFIPGFEEQLVGAKIGEDVSVLVTFPTEYHAPHLAGKAAEFKCKIHEIRVSTPYQPDDIFAKEFAKCDSFQEFHDKLASSMQDYVDYRGEMDLQDRLLKMAVETFEYEPAAEKVEREMDDQLDTLKAQLAQEGLTMEMYCSFMGTTEAQIREDSRNGAIASLRTQAAIEEIVFLEDLKAEEDEINQAVALVARQNNMTLEQLKPYYDEAFEASIVRHVLTSKVMKLMRDAAVITEK